jgi:hypothetical protein
LAQDDQLSMFEDKINIVTSAIKQEHDRKFVICCSISHDFWGTPRGPLRGTPNVPWNTNLYIKQTK